LAAVGVFLIDQVGGLGILLLDEVDVTLVGLADHAVLLELLNLSIPGLEALLKLLLLRVLRLGGEEHRRHQQHRDQSGDQRASGCHRMSPVVSEVDPAAAGTAGAVVAAGCVVARCCSFSKAKKSSSCLST